MFSLNRNIYRLPRTLALLAILACSPMASGAVTTVGCELPTSCTGEELANGGEFIIDDVRFFNFDSVGLVDSSIIFTFYDNRFSPGFLIRRDGNLPLFRVEGEPADISDGIVFSVASLNGREIERRSLGAGIGDYIDAASAFVGARFTLDSGLGTDLSAICFAPLDCPVGRVSDSLPFEVDRPIFLDDVSVDLIGFIADESGVQNSVVELNAVAFRLQVAAQSTTNVSTIGCESPTSCTGQELEAGGEFIVHGVRFYDFLIVGLDDPSIVFTFYDNPLSPGFLIKREGNLPIFRVEGQPVDISDGMVFSVESLGSREFERRSLGAAIGDYVDAASAFVGASFTLDSGLGTDLSAVCFSPLECGVGRVSDSRVFDVPGPTRLDEVSLDLVGFIADESGAQNSVVELNAVAFRLQTAAAARLIHEDDVLDYRVAGGLDRSSARMPR